MYIGFVGLFFGLVLGLICTSPCFILYFFSLIGSETNEIKHIGLMLQITKKKKKMDEGVLYETLHSLRRSKYIAEVFKALSFAIVTLPLHMVFCLQKVYRKMT